MSSRCIFRVSFVAVLLLAACTSQPATESTPAATNAPTNPPAAEPTPAATNAPTAVPAVEPTPVATNSTTGLIATPTVSPVAADPTPPLSDARVRTALAYCTDRAALLRALYPWLKDTGAFTAVTPPGATAETARLAGLPFAPEQGRALLDDAGWNRSPSAEFRAASGTVLTLKVTTTTSSDRRAWLETWAEQLAACGIDLDVDYRPAEWFYGEKTGLAVDEYQMAAFSRRADDGLDNDAIESPLFYRVEVFATHPQLENFVPPADGIHTRNAAEWRIPGRDTIIIGEDAEPAVPLESEDAYVARVVRALVESGDSGAPGPYRMTEWTHGSRIVLEANLQYSGPAPATSHIIIRFLPHDTVIQALLKGQVDILDWESLTPADVAQFGLDRAADTGTIRLLARPAAMWETVRFSE